MSEEKKLTPEEVKVGLMNHAAHLYNNLISFLRTLPIDEKQFSFATQNFDQGIMWIDQGIKALQFDVQSNPGEVHAEATTEATQGEDAPEAQVQVA